MEKTIFSELNETDAIKLTEALSECLNALKHSHDQIESDRESIIRLDAETQAYLTELNRVLNHVETAF